LAQDNALILLKVQVDYLHRMSGDPNYKDNMRLPEFMIFKVLSIEAFPESERL